MTTLARWIAPGLAAFALTGCALVDVNLKPPTTGLKTPIPGGNGRQIIVSVPFSDARQIRDRCGIQKGGYGNETAKAVCPEDPAKWMAEMLEKELQASGFTVLRTESGARDTALRVDGTLVKIFAEPVVGFWAASLETDLGVNLLATSKTGLRAERKFFSKSEMTAVLWTQGLFNDSAEIAIRDMLGKLVNAILELMSRYPELGSERPDRAIAVAVRLEPAR
jgi:hypothetical protein